MSELPVRMRFPDDFRGLPLRWFTREEFDRAHPDGGTKLSPPEPGATAYNGTAPARGD